MFKSKKEDVILKRFDRIDKALLKMQLDIKKLKQEIDSILNVESNAVLLNDEELWRREQKKAQENGF